MPKQAKILVAIGIAVIALGGALFYAQPDDHKNMNQAAPGQSLNIALDDFYDFGTISMKNGVVSQSFKLKNEQAQDIDLATIYTSCMCTTASIKLDGEEFGPFGMPGHGTSLALNRKLKAGAESQLVVSFDPNAHGPSGIGLIERTVSLQSDEGEVASLTLRANVTP